MLRSPPFDSSLLPLACARAAGRAQQRGRHPEEAPGVHFQPALQPGRAAGAAAGGAGSPAQRGRRSGVGWVLWAALSGTLAGMCAYGEGRGRKFGQYEAYYCAEEQPVQRAQTYAGFCKRQGPHEISSGLQLLTPSRSNPAPWSPCKASFLSIAHEGSPAAAPAASVPLEPFNTPVLPPPSPHTGTHRPLTLQTTCRACLLGTVIQGGHRCRHLSLLLLVNPPPPPLSLFPCRAPLLGPAHPGAAG